MFMDAPFELFDSFWINGVMQEIGVHYTAEEGSTRVTVLAQTIIDLDNDDYTAVAAFSREDGSNLLDIVTQDFTVNLTRPANVGSSGISNADVSASAGQTEAPEHQAPQTTQNTPAQNGGALPFIIAGAAVIVLAGGGVFVYLKKRRLRLNKDSFNSDISMR